MATKKQLANKDCYLCGGTGIAYYATFEEITKLPKGVEMTLGEICKHEDLCPECNKIEWWTPNQQIQ